MNQDQFYNCLNRILELRGKILETSIIRKKAQAIESAQAEEKQVEFDALRQFAVNKEKADRNTAAAQALLKELALQEAKLRAFVPVSAYGTRIKAASQDKPTIYVVLKIESIVIEKVEL